jgi:hypothetical protein
MRRIAALPVALRVNFPSIYARPGGWLHERALAHSL